MTTTERPVHHQSQSPLFARLPIEIRQAIYRAAWRSIIHIYLTEEGRLTSCTCITESHNGPDMRQVKIGSIFPPNPKYNENLTSPEWFQRLKDPWANHWECREAMVASAKRSRRFGRRRWSKKKSNGPFLSTMLCCKKMYLESVPQAFGAITFTFTEFATLKAWLGASPTPMLNQVQTIHLSTGDSNVSGNNVFETDIFLQTQLRGAEAMKAYEDVWDVLAGMTRLQLLCIWVECSNRLKRWFYEKQLTNRDARPPRRLGFSRVGEKFRTAATAKLMFNLPIAVEELPDWAFEEIGELGLEVQFRGVPPYYQARNNTLDQISGPNYIWNSVFVSPRPPRYSWPQMFR